MSKALEAVGEDVAILRRAFAETIVEMQKDIQKNQQVCAMVPEIQAEIDRLIKNTATKDALEGLRNAVNDTHLAKRDFEYFQKEIEIQ